MMAGLLRSLCSFKKNRFISGYTLAHSLKIRESERKLFITKKTLRRVDMEQPLEKELKTNKVSSKHCILSDEVTIRQCKFTETKHLLRMTRNLGWDNTEFDFEATFRLDPTSGLVAVDNSNIPVGFIFAVQMFQNSSYVCGLVVEEKARGKGIGRNLFNEMLHRKFEKNICLDAVDQLVGFYEQFGFVWKSFRSNVYSGVLDSYCKNMFEKTSTYEVLPVTQKHWTDLLKYDLDVFRGVSRENVLQTWLFGDCVYTYVALLNGMVCGYGCLVMGGTHEFCIKTLIADNGNVVDEIVRRMVEQIPLGSKLTFTLLDGKKLPMHLRAFQTNITLQRMFNKFSIETESEKIFCICCQFL